KVSGNSSTANCELFGIEKSFVPSARSGHQRVTLAGIDIPRNSIWPAKAGSTRCRSIARNFSANQRESLFRIKKLDAEAIAQHIRARSATWPKSWFRHGKRCF